ncbi:MAG: hypothetical protein KAT74_01185, partial [Candidatus Cloacimonetes bacterium]|nr:hypothetical protein [Candidatus Cloacimonadota bacterium]
FLSSTIINIPADQPTIQAGIDVAVDGDTVLVQPGTYVENINFNSKNIVVASHFLTTQDTSYISQTIIDGNQNGSVVTFDNGEDSTAVLMGFTITNGLGNGYPEYSGGGVTCRNYSNPSIDNVIITGSSADIGGGIYIVNSSPKIEECTITLNQVFEFGAGIYLIGGTPIIKNNEISFNSIPYGPGDGIYCSPSDSIEISGNIFIDNGILFWGGSFNNICIKDNIFENFISGSDKKAIEISGTSTSTKTVYIIDNYFSNFMLSGISSVIRLGGTGEALNTAIIERNCFVDLGCPAVSLGGTSDAVINGYINNNNFLDCIPSSYNNSIIRVGGTGNATIYGDIINNSFINCGTGMVDESVIDLGGTGYVTVYTSIIGNLILDSSTGIKVDGISGSQLNGILLNNTIVNNTKGIEKGSNVNQLQIINTILWNNDDDLLNIAESEIQFSNISDGDYSGINE